MKPETEVKVQLRYWEGKLEGLLEGTKAIESLGLEKSKEKVPLDAVTHLAVQKATATGWVDALRWVLKAEEAKAEL